jgi:hypothetical protein
MNTDQKLWGQVSIILTHPLSFYLLIIFWFNNTFLLKKVNCNKIGEVSYRTGSYQIECKQCSEYTAMLASGIVTLIIWGLVIPILLSLVMMKHTKDHKVNHTTYK